MHKLLVTIGVFVAAVGGIIAAPAKSSAASLPAVKVAHVGYQADHKQLSFTATAPKSAKKLAVSYHGQVKTYTLKHQQANVNYQFSGYRNFKVYGVNAKAHRVTRVKSLTSANYTTTEIINYDEQLTTKTYQVTIQTLAPHRTVALYHGTKRLQLKSTGTGQAVTFTMSAANYAKYGANLNYTVKATNKKASLPFELHLLKKPGNLAAIA